MFDNVARNYWNNPDNQKEFLEYVKGEMGVREMADWYKVTSDDIKRLGGTLMMQVQQKKNKKRKTKKQSKEKERLSVTVPSFQAEPCWRATTNRCRPPYKRYFPITTGIPFASNRTERLSK
jgi:hypothetical protein